MSTIRIRPATELEPHLRPTLERQRTRLSGLLPDAEVVHVGSTAIPGALTKGDLDLLVRVPAARFEAAVATLRDSYAIHQPENWTATYASFLDPDAVEPPVGVQLAIAGSHEDLFFEPFIAALTRDPSLLAEYNALKRSLDGTDYERYTTAKAVFVERVLGLG